MTVSMQWAQPVRRPNFFILGAARCGTTSLHYLLDQHPDIFLTDPKEPTFFCEQFTDVANAIEYFRLFDAAGDRSIRGEASHAYLSDPAAPRVLHALFPDARFLVILRDPAHRAHSLYHWMRRHGLEPCGSFESALAAEETRANDPKFRRHCKQYLGNYLYFRSGLYGEQLARYLTFFPRRQFHIVAFETFFAEPAIEFRHVLEFLKVDPEFVPHFAAQNAGGTTPRHVAIERLLRSKLPLGPVRKLTRWVSRHWNQQPIARMSPHTHSMLRERYAPDQDRLRQIIRPADSKSPGLAA